MATGATEFIDGTTAAQFIPQIWSKEVLIARENSLVFSMLVNHQYERDARIGNTVNVAAISNLSTQTKSLSANAATVYETITEANTAITIGTWAYSAIAVETATKQQVHSDLLALYAPKQGYALAQKVDDDLAALPDDFSQTVGTLIAELTYEDVLRARQYLNDADVPLDDRVIVVSPAQEAGFMKLNHFINGDYSNIAGNPQASQKQKAYMGTWLKMPVYMSVNVEGTNAAGHDNAMFHKEALACVIQMEPTTHAMFDVDYLANKVVVEQLYGVKEMRDDHGVWMQGA